MNLYKNYNKTNLLRDEFEIIDDVVPISASLRSCTNTFVTKFLENEYKYFFGKNLMYQYLRHFESTDLKWNFFNWRNISICNLNFIRISISISLCSKPYLMLDYKSMYGKFCKINLPIFSEEIWRFFYQSNFTWNIECLIIL